MIDPGLAISGIGALISAIALFVSLRARRFARMSVLAAELRPALVSARYSLGSVVAEGGKESLWVINQTGEITARLEEFEPGIDDEKLRWAVTSVRDALAEVLANAAGHGQLGSDPKQLQRQVNAARSGCENAKLALERLSSLQGKGS